MRRYLKQIWAARTNKLVLAGALTFALLLAVLVLLIVAAAQASVILVAAVLLAGYSVGFGKDLVSACFSASALPYSVMIDHGKTIAEVIRRLRRLPVECVALFDCDDEKITELTSFDPHAVKGIMDSMTELKLERTPGGTMVHNHPQSRGPFSPEDIECAIDMRLSWSILVAEGVLYTIELTPRHWRLDSEKVAEEYCRLLDEPQKFGLRPPRKIANGEYKYEVKQGVAICQYLAEEYGFKFSSQPYRKSPHYRR